MADFTYEDEQDWRFLSYTWALASDTKDWSFMTSICTPTVKVHYSAISTKVGDTIRSVADYKWSFLEPLLGDKDLQTQHLLGAAEFTSEDETHATGTWQIRVVHVRLREGGRPAEYSIGSYVDHFYERVDGAWKLAGVRPHTVLWELGKKKEVFGEDV